MKLLLRPICWLMTAKKTLHRYMIQGVIDGTYIDGHDYVETLNEGEISILECDLCGYTESQYL